jgi:cell division protein ZapA
LKQAVEVTILGRQLTVKSEASPAEVRRVAEFVNRKITEVMSAGRLADTLSCALLALMNVSGAFLLLQDQTDVESDETVRTCLRALLERMERADFDGEEGMGQGPFVR